MSQGQCTEFRRQGEGHQEVLAGYEGLELALQPLLALVVLTVGAQPVAAGMGHPELLLAGRAAGLHFRAQCRPAGFHGRQGLVLLRLQPVAVLGQERRLELFDEGSEMNDFTPLQPMEKPAISVLMRIVALCSVWPVRWVYLAVVRTEWWPRIFWTSSRSTPASIRWVA